MEYSIDAYFCPLCKKAVGFVGIKRFSLDKGTGNKCAHIICHLCGDTYTVMMDETFQLVIIKERNKYHFCYKKQKAKNLICPIHKRFIIELKYDLGRHIFEIVD